MRKPFSLIVFLVRVLSLVAGLRGVSGWLMPAHAEEISHEADPAFRPDKIERIDRVIQDASDAQRCPGAVLHLEHKGSQYQKSYGCRALQPVVEPMSEDTIFD